jgi:hypothetical protein
VGENLDLIAQQGFGAILPGFAVDLERLANYSDPDTLSRARSLLPFSKIAAMAATYPYPSWTASGMVRVSAGDPSCRKFEPRTCRGLDASRKTRHFQCPSVTFTGALGPSRRVTVPTPFYRRAVVPYRLNTAPPLLTPAAGHGPRPTEVTSEAGLEVHTHNAVQIESPQEKR